MVVHVPVSRTVLLGDVFGVFLDDNFFAAAAAPCSLSAAMTFVAKHQLGKPVGEKNNCFKSLIWTAHSLLCQVRTCVCGDRQGKVLGREGEGGADKSSTGDSGTWNLNVTRGV
jgi:hypothetical protein